MTASIKTAGRGRITTAGAYFSSEFILGLFSALIGPALPFLAQATGSSLDSISLVFVLASLGYLLGSLAGGWAYDRVPGHRLMGLALVGVAASGTLIPFLGTLGWLLAVFFLLGLMQGINDVGCNTQLLWLFGQDVGPFMNGLHFSFGLGTAAGPLILAAVLSATGRVSWTFWLCAGLCLPLAAWLLSLPDPAPPQSLPEEDRGPQPALPIILLVAAFALAVGAEFGFGNWIYTYTLKLGLGTTITAAYLTSAFWGTFTLSRLFGIWISTRLRSITILLTSLLGGLASLGILLLWPGSAAVLWMAAIGTGFFTASLFPTLLVLVGERLEVTGLITGWMLVGGGIGGMVLPWLIGQAFSVIGFAALPYLVLISTALNLLVLLIFTVTTRAHSP